MTLVSDKTEWKEILTNTFNFEKEFFESLGIEYNKTFDSYLEELYNELKDSLEDLDKYVRTHNRNKRESTKIIERNKSTVGQIHNKKNRRTK